MDLSHTAPPTVLVETLIAAAEEAEREGRRQAARELYEKALYSLREPGEAALAGNLLRWIARTHFVEGALEVATEIATAALLVGEHANDAGGVAHANNLLGGIERERGELHGAEVLFRLARRQALAAGEGRLVA
ncbi:MAG TPA: hypothetical protein VFQ39_02835, partial [Longimicrobium sp.]|nr:hypothetical protein [Longimicrobium sp.]